MRAARTIAGLGAVAAVLTWGATAHAGGNFPPIASADADPLEALVGEDIQFSSAGSLDPDDGPSPLGFAWDFGDGTQSTDPNPIHAYADLGVHIVTLTVTDGLAQSLVNLEVVTLPPPTPVPPAASGPLSLSPDQAWLAVVNPDSDSVSVVDLADESVLEHAACDDPRAVAWAADGSAVWVTCHGDGTLVALEPVDGTEVATVPTCHQPFGVAVAPVTGDAVVSCYGAATVQIYPPDLSAPVDVIVPQGPRAIAVEADGTLAWVTHLLTTGETGLVSRIDLTTGMLVETVDLVEDPGPDTSSSGAGYVNVLASIAVDPAGTMAWVGAIKANTGRGPVLDGQDLHPRNRLRGVLAPIDLASGGEVLPRRIDTNDADGVSALAFSPRGRYAYLTHQGASRLSVYDIPSAELVDPSDGTPVNFDARIDTGDAPHGVVVDADGDRAYVANFLSRNVVIYDLTDPSSPVELSAIAVTGEPLSDVLARGKRLFFGSREPVQSDQNYIACASCHPDGGHDGRTWDFTQFGEGLRNTIDLRGRAGTGHGPVHWTANFDEIQDFENDIQNGFGGDGLLGGGELPHPPLGESNAGRSEDLDALAAYVASLGTFVRSPYRQADGSLSDAALRGYDLFFDETVGCATCHAPPRFTDSELTPDPADYVRHDVGTIAPDSGQGLGMELVGFDTPTVIGVWATAPYLHDGRAATLTEVLTTYNAGDAHGTTSHLSAEDIDDLVAFLLSLQGDEDEYPELPGGDDTTGGEGDETTGGADDGSMTTTGIDSAGSTGGGDESGTTSSADDDAGSCACRGGDDSPRPLLATMLLLALARRRRNEGN